ncbi:MAG: OsmC family protein [Deltaproteobacteria bacterium]|nr:OsmC family protein [Deltaproteobacteria bacterium]
MKMEVSLQQGFLFKATCASHEVMTDQPEKEGGTDRAMTPAELFIASLGTCIGVYAVRFCKRHNLRTEGLKVSLDWTVVKDPWRIGSIKAEIYYPHNIPETEKKGLLRMAEACFVHETILHKPEIVMEMK